MIKAYLNKKKHPTVFGCNIEDIEGYEDAILSKSLYNRERVYWIRHGKYRWEV